MFLSQAFQLIRAVSVLLNFSREEEDMLKQTLEYKVLPSFIHRSRFYSNAPGRDDDVIWMTYDPQHH